MIFFDSLRIAILLGATIMNILLSLFVYKNNPRSATNIIFSILGVLISLWLVILYLAQDSAFSAYALEWTRGSITIAMPMSFSFFLLAHTFPYPILRLPKKTFFILLFATLCVMLINISPLAFPRVEMVSGGLPRPIPGPGMLPFGLLSTIFSIGSVYYLVKKTIMFTGIEKIQIKFVTTGIFLMLGLIIFTIFIPVLLFNNAFFVPFAPLYTLLFLTMTAYAIVKHHLLEIRAMLTRTVSFIFFITICVAIYAFILTVIVQKIFKLTVPLWLSIGSLLMIILVSLTFQPLYTQLQRFTRSIFYKDQYDSDKLLMQLTRIMATVIDLSVMTQTLLSMLMQEMHLTKAALILIDKEKATKILGSGYPQKITKGMKWVELFTKYGSSQTSFVFEELHEGTLKKTFRELDIAIAIPIRVETKPSALLLVGPKLSGEVYSKADIDFLTLFASEAGIAMEKAKSYEEIKKFNKELEHRVTERTRELRESQESELAKARDIAKLKDEFVFIAAHELKTPVTALQGFLQLLNESKKPLPSDVQEKLRFMGLASTHLHQLTNDLLEVARSETGAMKIAVHPVDLPPVIKNIVEEIAPLADQRRIHINFRLFGEIPKVLVDEEKIKEIIMNFVSNAVKYNREGGVIDIHVFPVEDKLMIEVKDNGFGIPKADQEKIFQKFFRAHSKGTEEVLGTGLGLFITRMLAEKMGGQIGFSSVEGAGSLFTVFIPQAR